MLGDYACPACGHRVATDSPLAPRDHQAWTCPRCRAGFELAIDGETGREAFMTREDAAAVEPLFLPRGSIRALIALQLVIAYCYVLAATGRAPGYLLSLLLTVVGFYFGYRARGVPRGTLFDARPEVRFGPLFLPAGAVRGLIMLGVVASGVLLLVHGRLHAPEYLDFSIIIGGVIAGQLFRKALPSAGKGAALLAHLKGVLVLGLTVALAYLVVSGRHASLPPVAMASLCATVSFYFGSR